MFGVFRPVFRSYRPQAEKLQEGVLPTIKPGDGQYNFETCLFLGKHSAMKMNCFIVIYYITKYTYYINIDLIDS